MASFSDISKGSFRNELMSTLRSLAPYSNRDMVEMISQDNPKYKHFYPNGTRRDEILTNHSISQGNPYDQHPMGEFSLNGDYHAFMYANVEPDKLKRLQEYRLMAGYDFINSALDKICDEFIVINDKDEIFEFNVDESIDKQERETLREEFYKFVQHFDLENKGWEYIRNILVDGELYFENIIHEEHRDKGILGIVSVPTESIDPVFNNVQNLLVRGYLLRKPIYDEQTKQVKEIIPIIFDKNQITYFHSNEWNEGKTFRLPHLEHARRAYKQINMIEDSIVIHRLVNAPEKLIFKIDVGNMPQAQSERYINQLAQKYWSKKTYDSKQGGVNMFNPQSMLDAFWFPKRAGSDGTDVTKLPGGQNLGDLPDLDYFAKKLFQSLKVPVNRLASDSSYSDGTDMLREELEFAKFIIRLQRQFTQTIKQTFITHLKLRGWWEEYKLSDRKLKIKMNEPTHFHVLRDQQLFEIQSSNYSNMAQSELVSESYAQKLYLKWDDKQILANREHLRKEMAFKWELQSIASYGPDWRRQMENAEGGVADDFDAGGADLGGGGGGAMGGETDFGGGGSELGGAEDMGGAEDFGTAPDVSGGNEEED
jgi:hypothetical protein